MGRATIRLRLNLRVKLLISSLAILLPILLLLIQDYLAAYDAQKNEVIADQIVIAKFVPRCSLASDLHSPSLKIGS